MEDLLLEAGLDVECSSSVAELLGQLRREVAELRTEVSRLRRENLELRQQAGYWQSRHADAVRRIAVLELENEHLRSENRKLQAQALGEAVSPQEP
jgi:cell division septum initiation protein DivIVA